MKNLVESELWWKGPTWLNENHDRDWPLEPMIDADKILAGFEDELLKTQP